MTSLPLVRTEYVNVSTGTVRSGATSHGESFHHAPEAFGQREQTERQQAASKQ
jgi:hypothetical protein